MWKFFFITGFILGVHVTGFAQAYGLAFNSHEVALEKRTSLDLSPDDSLCFSKNMELSFDFNFIPNRRVYFGYVLRIISSDYQNIDLIYNPKLKVFKLILDDHFTNISFTIDSPRLYKDWNRLQLKFDMDNHTMQFFTNGKSAGTSPLPDGIHCFKFLWGASDFQKFKTRDLPPMRIRDVKIFENNILKYAWSLNEFSGDSCYDSLHRQMAKIKNPDWIKPKHLRWDLISNFTIKGYSGIAYDPKQDRLLVVGSDSIAAYSFSNIRDTLSWVPSHLNNLRLGNQAIFDTSRNQLLDIYIDQQKVIGFDFANRQWDADFDAGKITEFWHANKFISLKDSALYIFGGYGQLKYKNLVQRYSFATKKWEIINPSGDYFSPRYMSALGQDPGGNYVYIIGGYGSKTGDQMLDPGNYYDLLRFDIKTKSFKKLYTFRPSPTRYTFANSLVVDPKTKEFYGLIFPNDSSNSNLQLIRGSLTDSNFTILANSIPFNFHDVESFIDLYYSPVSNKLFAVILHYSRPEEKISSTDVKIFSIDFPPQPSETPESEKRQEKPNYPYILISVVALAILLFIFRKKLFRKNAAASITPSADAGTLNALYHPTAGYSYQQANNESSQQPAIYLFGQFQAFDKEGNDITRLFTPLLKELFLIITIYTIRNSRGISSEGLDEILWHDKSNKDAKNNRAVNITKLKTILERIGVCTINKESGLWQFQILDESIYLDYSKYISIVRKGLGADMKCIHLLVDIIKRGAFLYQTEYDWLDTIKAEISNSIIDICLEYFKSQDISKDPEFVIEITNCIFYFDQLNEYALINKCKSLILLKRHTLANKTYLKFVKDYMDIYGENFSKSFQEIIA
jgi:hypothetical protein